MPRPKAKGSFAQNQLQLAIALSTSLEESKNRELSKLAEELPADAVEKGAIPDNIKQMQKEFLERLQPVAAAPSKRKRKTTKTQIPVLYTRSSEDRMRIITEKVALTLIDDNDNVSFFERKAVCRKLYLNCKNEAYLWKRSFLLPAIEERHFYNVESLSAFISWTHEGVNAVRRKRIPLPGRFLSPQKRDPDVATLPNLSQSKSAHEINSTQNWCNATLLDDRDVSNQEAQRQFQNDWLSMLNCKQFSDFKVYTKHGEEIGVHKLVLHVRCPTILEDLETSDSLRWEDVDYHDALAFLKFIYSGLLEAYLQYSRNSGVVFLAKKYKVIDLLNHIFASDSDLFETELTESFETSNSQENANTRLKPGEKREVVHPISNSAADSPPLEKEREKKKMLERSLPTFSRRVDSPILISSGESSPLEKCPEEKTMLVKSPTLEFLEMSDNSKRKLRDENTPRKFTGKKLCVKVIDTEEDLSPVKSSLQKISISDLEFRDSSDNSNPTTLHGEWKDISDHEQVPSPCDLSTDYIPPLNDKSVDSESSFTKSHHSEKPQVTGVESEIQSIIAISDSSNSNPVTPLREWKDVTDDEQVPSPFDFHRCNPSPLNYESMDSESSFTGSHHLEKPHLTGVESENFNKSLESNSSQKNKTYEKHSLLQLTQKKPEILQKSLGADPLIQIAEASELHSPMKAAKLSSDVTAVDYKMFLEDSFCFDLRTPRQVRPEDTGPLRTPLTDVKTSSPITPMPDFLAMGVEQLQAELCKFGLKRNLTIKKSIKMLTHIYEKQHPLVEVVVKDGRELYVPIGDKTPGRSTDVHTTDPLPLAVPLELDEPEPSDDGKSLSDSSSDEGEVIEESMFADEDNAGYEGLTDLQATVQAWISSNKDLYEKVLRYEPIWLESVHSELKEYTHQNIKLSHLMNILDEEGVTYRIAQKNVEGSRKKKKRSPKK